MGLRNLICEYRRKKMGRGRTLSAAQRGQIVAYRHSKKTIREIAELVGCSKSAVSYELNVRCVKRAYKPRGRPKKISPRAKRAILRSRPGRISAARLKFDHKVEVGVRRIQQILRSSGLFKWTKMKVAPKLKPIDMENRVKWAESMLNLRRSDWRVFIFSDEKKFNLDGPDGNRYYWHDLRKEPSVFSKRHSGGGSIMIWSTISYTDQGPVVEVKGRMKGPDYVKMLDEHLVDLAAKIGHKHWVFQQDNAPCHRANVTKEWFEANNIRVLDWPPYSPDLNPIENWWGAMVREVYKDGRQFQSIPELRAEVLRVANTMDKTPLKKLFDSMLDRCIAVVKAGGARTGY